MRRSAPECGEHVSQCCCRQRSHNPDRFRHCDRLALMLGIKQALTRQLLFQTQELLVQITKPGSAHSIHLQLIVTPRLVQGNGCPELKLLTRLRCQTNQSGAISEHNRPDSGGLILDREIPVTGGRLGKVGDFPPDPDLGEFRSQQSTYCPIKLSNRKNDARRRICHKKTFVYPHRSAMLSTENTVLSNHCNINPITANHAHTL